MKKAFSNIFICGVNGLSGNFPLKSLRLLLFEVLFLIILNFHNTPACGVLWCVMVLFLSNLTNMQYISLEFYCIM